MLNVNKRHVKECELPVAFPSIPIQVLHFTSSLFLGTISELPARAKLPNKAAHSA